MSVKIKKWKNATTTYSRGRGGKTFFHRHLPPLSVLPNSVDWFLIQCLGFHPSGGGGLLSLRHNITGRQWLIYNSIWTKYPRWNGIAHTTTVSMQLCTSHFSLSIPSAVSCSTWLLSENWTNIRIFCQAGIFVYLQKGVHGRTRSNQCWNFRVPVSDMSTFWYPWIFSAVHKNR